ncbi:MAG: glycosyltransferase N-terminal domain-containing protein [Pseudorhodobacter sp.]|nr:glycosyltransferase N-terminal domain-containing protein [Pseudorhodobacter sp.]
MRLYRLLIWLALPALVAALLWQRLRGQAPRGALAERLGWAGTRPRGPLLWLHGASNGELTSVRWLIARLMADAPQLSLLITCNSTSARAMVQGWALPRATVQLAPFDSRGAMRRFLAQWHPTALVIVENELWPERIQQAAAHGPVLLIGARMSERSARNWGRLAPGLMRAMLTRLSFVSAQDAASETRLRALGLPAARLGPRLMLKSRAVTVPAGKSPPFTPVPPRARCLLAASTHAGEDAAILDGFAQARTAGRFDLLILAPRHPRRAPAIATLIAARGLTFATRSAGEVPGPETAVYLADTLGEMALWYGMAGATIIGGSFGTAGGHTPFEPAAHGSAIIHGASVANFSESFAALDNAGAGRAVPTPGALGATLLTLNAAEQRRLADAALHVLAPAEDEASLLAAILQAIDPTDKTYP